MAFTPKKLPTRAAKEDGIRVKPSDLVGSLLLVQPVEIKTGIKTKHSPPEGSKALVLNVVSVETGNVAPDQMWFNPGIVDALEDSIGDVVGGRIAWVTGASGNAYLVIEETSDADDEAIAAFAAANPTIFDTKAPAGQAATTASPAPQQASATPAPAVVSPQPAAAAPSRW